MTDKNMYTLPQKLLTISKYKTIQITDTIHILPRYVKYIYLNPEIRNNFIICTTYLRGDELFTYALVDGIVMCRPNKVKTAIYSVAVTNCPHISSSMQRCFTHADNFHTFSFASFAQMSITLFRF